MGIIAVNTLLTAAAVWLPYQFLVEMATLVAAPTTLLLAVTYIRHKQRSHQVARVFNATSGPAVAVVLVLAPVVIV